MAGLGWLAAADWRWRCDAVAAESTHAETSGALQDHANAGCQVHARIHSIAPPEGRLRGTRNRQSHFTFSDGFDIPPAQHLKWATHIALHIQAMRLLICQSADKHDTHATSKPSLPRRDWQMRRVSVWSACGHGLAHTAGCIVTKFALRP